MKKMLLTVISVALLTTVGFVGFGVVKTMSSQQRFAESGYVLHGDGTELKRLDFSAGEAYRISRAGVASFTAAGGERVTVPKENFIHLDDGSVIALAGGILLDFDDLSDNFINNYYISSGLPVVTAGGSGRYTAQTSGGTVSFGENLWKLSDGKYLIQSPNLSVRFSDSDLREVSDYVKVSVTDDGIVQLLTPENLWTTISEEIYIETAGGVRVYPVTGIIDDGSNRLSVAKLAVNADDAIVLTKAEIRKQIVPELRLEAVDGSDGEVGRAGQSGQTGEQGEQGETGETGVAGEGGSEGAPGQGGETGVTGNNGAYGAAGASGASGASGATGASGAAGAQGVSGGDGASGGNGARGAAGNNAVESGAASALPNMTIGAWNVTATTLTGAILIDLDTVDFLAEMDRHIDGDPDMYTKYAASVTVTDATTGETYSCFRTSDIYVFDVPTDPTGLYEGGGNFTLAFNGDNESVYFTLDPEVTLTPDTRYVLSVNAYYKANHTIFQREFISRAFYPDSTGAILSKSEAGLKNEAGTWSASLQILVGIGGDYRDAIRSAKIALLTPTENAAVNAVNFGDTVNAIPGRLFEINYGAETATRNSEPYNYGGDIYNSLLTFDGLASNTRYVARVLVEMGSGSTMLTNQQLELQTLKLAPTVSGVKTTPTANYNRVTGAIEVSRPVVTDPDAAVTEYVYTAYKAGAPDTPVVERVVAANARDPVSFFLGTDLESGADYVFGVTMRYYDNEKSLSGDIGRSASIRVTGDTMPKMILTTSESAIKYNMMEGAIITTLANTSHIDVAPDKPLTLEVYADRIYDETITLDNAGEVNSSGTPVERTGGGGVYMLYKVSAEYVTDNELKINLDFDNLYMNTRYTISVSGWLNVGDGNGVQMRTIGSVSFATPNAPVASAAWNPPQEGTVSSSIARALSLDPVDTKGQTDTYARGQLMQGSVTVDLYSGTGVGRRLIGSKIYTKADSPSAGGSPGAANAVEQFYMTTANTGIGGTGVFGYLITESDFGSPALSANADYTLVVSSVTDQTYGISELSYVNAFERDHTTEPIQAVPAPPDLIQSAQTGVTATPILNKDAGNYGAVYDRSKPDDMIIGYKLQANFDNETRRGVRVSYYSMEYQEFYQTIVTNGKDPLGFDTDSAQVSKNPANLLMKMTQPFDASSDTAPAVAILFGGAQTHTQWQGNDGNAGDLIDTPGGGGPTLRNGVSVYYAGDASTNGNALTYGMDRGFRYIFAYTVDYASGASGDNAAQTLLYPYTHARYDAFRTQYGAGTQYGKPIGMNVVYLLNSGMCEAPRVAPDFHSYVYDTVEMQGSNAGSGGKLQIDFKYRDYDNTIITVGQNQTQITYDAGNGPVSVPIAPGGDVATVGNGWYRLTVPYSLTGRMPALVEPWVGIADYRINYDNLMLQLTGGTSYANRDSKFYLAHVPVEFAWGDQFLNAFPSYGQYQVGYVILTQDMGHLDENYILYTLSSGIAGSPVVADLVARTYAVKLTFTVGTGDGNLWTPVPGVEPKTLYIPIEEQSNGTWALKVATGRLGAEFLSGNDNRSFRVKAEALFDDGRQGWNLIDEPGALFGIQNVNEISGSDTQFGFYGYYADGNRTLNVPTGGVMQNGGALRTANLRGNVADSYRNATTGVILDTKSYASFAYLIQPTGNFGRYLYPSRFGVDTDGYSNIESLTGRYTVPKGCGAFTLTFMGGLEEGRTGSGQIGTMTPTIKLRAAPSNFSTGISFISVNQYTVSGYGQADLNADGQYEIWMRAYKTENDARNLNQGWERETVMYLKTSGDGERGPQSTHEKTGSGDASDIYGSSVAPLGEGAYYIAVFMKIDGDDKLLVDADTALTAVYLVRTGTEVNFSSAQGLIYTNTEYFTKHLRLNASMSRYLGVTLSYDIFRTSDVIPTEWMPGSLPAPLIANDVLRLAGGILTAPPALGANNNLDFNLEPSVARSLLAPGGAYRLRITAMEGSAYAGSATYDFSIPPSGNNGALIYVADATSAGINFQVTITDPQYSFMGHKKQDGTQGEAGALYAVRFAYRTDDDVWARLYTVYDDDLFSAQTPKQMFALMDGTLLLDTRNPWSEWDHGMPVGNAIQPGTDYRLYVFAVKDMNHDGLSDSPVGGAGRAWDYFFTTSTGYFGPRGYGSTGDTGYNPTGGGNSGNAFHALIDSFWLPDSTPDPDGDISALMLGFEAAEKTQSTADIGGILINAGQAGVARESVTRLRLTLAESFGIIDFANNNAQTFRRIDWSVDGYMNSGTSVSYSGSSRSDPPPPAVPDEMFLRMQDSAGYDIYTYTIPQDVTQGSYTIVIYLYRNESDQTPYDRLSFKYIG
jgi:hypothetical protein